jgi:hypothetical protein
MRVSIMSKTLAGLVLLLGSTALQAADFSLTDLMQQLGQKSPARPPLWKKYIAMLKQPLESSGELAFTAPDRLENARSSPSRKPCCWKATS